MQHEWQIWLDANISPIIAKWIKDELDLTAKSAYTLELLYNTDLEIYHQARSWGKIILISKDTDFSEIITRLGGPPKLINIKIGNCDNRQLWSVLKSHLLGLVTLLSSTDIDIVDFE